MTRSRPVPSRPPLVPRARLERLVDPAAIRRLVTSAGALDPGATFSILAPDGRVLAATRPADDGAGAPDAVLPIMVGGERVGIVAVGSDGDARAAIRVGRFLADAIAVAASEGAARRAVAEAAIDRRPDRPPFDAADRRLLASAASQTGIALERGALQLELLRRRQVDDELAIGRRIQRSLMPRRFPTLPGWGIAASYEAAREVGGDLYDAFPMRGRSEELGFVVADVTGKGIAAAILMADARALLHAAADHTADPAETLERVNRILVDERATGLFLTAAHGLIDVATGRLRLASAGHDPVLIVRADGSITSLTPAGRLMGMTATIDARTVEDSIAPGDALVAYTDGVTEARAPDGAFFGEERLLELLHDLAAAPAATIVERVVAEVGAFRGGAEPSDDLTLLVIGRMDDA